MPIPGFRRAYRAPRIARAMTRLVAVAAMFIASLAATGTASAVPASGKQGGASTSLAPSAPANSGHGKAAAKQCFYTFPNCTSTDPTAKFRIVRKADNSSCTFQYTTDWGDGKKYVMSFPGGPNGATLSRFSHTYDVNKPQTWSITVTGVVTSGTSCTANGGTLMFTLLPKLGVGAVRFAPLADQSTNTTPGLPVIKDDGPSVTLDGQRGPTSCDDITSPRSYDYLDCGKPVPTGSPAKVWPVIYAKGDTLTLDQVVFVANGQVPSPQLTATASISGSATASFSLPATTLSQAAAGSGYLLTASALTFPGALPAVPGRDKLTIKSTVTDLTSRI